MSEDGNGLSEETLKMFSILDEYEKGNLNLSEASEKLTSEHFLSTDEAIKTLTKLKRENVVSFPTSKDCFTPIKKSKKQTAKKGSRNQTRRKLDSKANSVSKVCDVAKMMLKEVIVIGKADNGDIKMMTTIDDTRDIVCYLETTKNFILNENID